MSYRRKLRGTLAICKEQLKAAALTPRVWLGYLFGISAMLWKTTDYLGYSGSNAVQVFEPFIIVMNDYTYSAFILLGLLVVLVDSPFINDRSIYVAVRGSRRSWYCGMLLYLIAQILFYYLAIFAATALFCIQRTYIKNVWSESCYMLGMFHPQEALLEWGMVFAGEQVIPALTPGEAFGLTYLLNVLYAVLLLFIAFLINMTGRWILGNLAAILIHLAGNVLIKSVYAARLIWYSPLGYSQLVFRQFDENGVADLYRPLLFFGFFLTAGFTAGLFMVKRNDFITAKGDREL